MKNTIVGVVGSVGVVGVFVIKFDLESICNKTGLQQVCLKSNKYICSGNNLTSLTGIYHLNIQT